MKTFEQITEKLIDEKEYTLTRYRWVILFLFSGCVLNPSLVGIGYSPIALQVSEAYGVNIFWVNFCALSSSVWYVPMTMCSSLMYSKMKRHHVMIIAAAMQVAGAWFRLIPCDQKFWPILVGQTIVAASLPIVLNAVSLVANLWFGEKERNIATTIPSLASVSGSIFCLAITGMISGNIPLASELKPSDY